MQYIQVQFDCNPANEVITDVLAALLAEIGFETFVPANRGLDAYLPATLFSEKEIDDLLSEFPMEATITYSSHAMEDKDWNEEWEKNYFQPIVIDEKVCIHSSFHRPEKEYEYNILIDPKMAFGTGHHQTTGLMMKEILAMNLAGKSVLDMGCGTALLAILASMKGAERVTAIDIDEWAYSNALENVQLNGTENIRVLQGGAGLLGSETYDVILANINRNILLRDFPLYVNVLNVGGQIVMSGFFAEDIPAIRAKSEEYGLVYQHFLVMDQWVAVSFRF